MPTGSVFYPLLPKDKEEDELAFDPLRSMDALLRAALDNLALPPPRAPAAPARPLCLGRHLKNLWGGL